LSTLFLHIRKDNGFPGADVPVISASFKGLFKEFLFSLGICPHNMSVSQGAYNSRKPGNLGEFVDSGKLTENSGKLKYTW